MLHLLNGGCTEAVLAQTSVPGVRFSFRDVLIAGPTPAVNGSQWRRIRSEHLAQAYGVEPEQCEKDFARQDELFDSFSRHDEVTLWFEADLFCQANLLYVLDWCAHHDLGAAKLSLICIGEFPGRPNFRGLGELTPEELASLFPDRSEVTTRQLELAARAWQAYRASDPQELERLLQTDTAELPFIKDALQLQLERFPSVRNGINRIENQGLKLIAAGFEKFADLFPRFVEAEADYGLGDAQFWNVLQRLTRGAHPLLNNVDGDDNTEPNEDFAFAGRTLKITDAGKAVLNGEADALSLNGIDEWLGGVHLVGDTNIWRWDEVKGRLVRA